MAKSGKRFAELQPGDVVGSRTVDFTVALDLGFVRVYWRGDSRPTVQAGTAVALVSI